MKQSIVNNSNQIVTTIMAVNKMNYGTYLFSPVILFLVGCASYSRFPSEQAVTANQLLREFGVDHTKTTIITNELIGNTLHCSQKAFVTDSSKTKRYFGSKGTIFYQDVEFKAYGVIPIPWVSDKKAQGEATPYEITDGVIMTFPDCGYPEKMIVTKDTSNGKTILWLDSCRASVFNWSKLDCSIETGNTLSVKN